MLQKRFPIGNILERINENLKWYTTEDTSLRSCISFSIKYVEAAMMAFDLFLQKSLYYTLAQAT